MSRVTEVVARVIVRQHKIAGRVVQLAGTPSLSQLYQAAGTWHSSADSLLEDVEAAGVEMLVDADEVLDELTRRVVECRYPSFFAVEPETCRAMYALVRARRPSVVVETGVADGRTTEMILRAMAANAHGRLHSIDIADDVGAYVTDADRWQLHVVAPERAAVVRTLDEIGPCDVFLHDSDHSYQWQRFEYEAAWGRLTSGGLLVSDDVDMSFAFVDFAARLGVRPALLMDRRKVLGVLTRRSAALGGTPSSSRS